VSTYWPLLLGFLALSNVVTLVLLVHVKDEAKRHKRNARTWRGLAEDWERSCDSWTATAGRWEELAIEFLHKLPCDYACSEPEQSARCKP
jgi:hypothetical protein